MNTLKTLIKTKDKNSPRYYATKLIVSENHIAVTDGFGMLYINNNRGLEPGLYSDFLEKLDAQAPGIDYVINNDHKASIDVDGQNIFKLCYKLPVAYSNDVYLHIHKETGALSFAIGQDSDDSFIFNPKLIAKMTKHLIKNQHVEKAKVYENGTLSITFTSGYSIIVNAITL